jgi:hypothetical protein
MRADDGPGWGVVSVPLSCMRGLGLRLNLRRGLSKMAGGGVSMIVIAVGGGELATTSVQRVCTVLEPLVCLAQLGQRRSCTTSANRLVLGSAPY